MPGATDQAGSPGCRRAQPRPGASSPGLASPAAVPARRSVVAGALVVPGRVFRFVRGRLDPGVALLAASGGPLLRLRGDRRKRLGQGIGEVAEDVGRVVELDEVVG